MALRHCTATNEPHTGYYKWCDERANDVLFCYDENEDRGGNEQREERNSMFEWVPWRGVHGRESAAPAGDSRSDFKVQRFIISVAYALRGTGQSLVECPDIALEGIDPVLSSEFARGRSTTSSAPAS